MDFVTKSFRKATAITPKSEDKYVVKVFNWSEFHLFEMTCYKIHTLVELRIETYLCNSAVGKGTFRQVEPLSYGIWNASLTVAMRFQYSV